MIFYLLSGFVEVAVERCSKMILGSEARKIMMSKQPGGLGMPQLVPLSELIERWSVCTMYIVAAAKLATVIVHYFMTFRWC
jgi:hypothetical protein